MPQCAANCKASGFVMALGASSVALVVDAACEIMPKRPSKRPFKEVLKGLERASKGL